MRASTWICGLAAGLLATGAAARERTTYEVDKAVPVAADGCVLLDAQAGPVTFVEVLLEDLPSEVDPRSAPDAVVVVSNLGDDEADLSVTVTLEDADGVVLDSATRSFELDEYSTNETFSVFHRGVGSRHLAKGEWPRVKTVRLVARVVM